MDLKKSLQSIKNDIVKNEEILKVLQKSYPHLAYLSEKQILAYFNVSSMDALHAHMKHIQESQKPQNTPAVQKNEICSCTDSNGETKELYDSEVSAKKQMNTLSKEKRLPLRIYICPDGCGWHLTKG